MPSDSSDSSQFAADGAVCLLDALLERYQLKNDAALSRRMEIAPSRLSKMRNGKQPVTADLLLRIHETFGMPFSELRILLRERPSFLHTTPGRPDAAQPERSEKTTVTPGKRASRPAAAA